MKRTSGFFRTRGSIVVMTALWLVAALPLGSCSPEPPPPPPCPDGARDCFDAVVIGAGGGGLAAAAGLALGGEEVLVIEQHDKVGGYMTAFERGPYRFEASLHAMDGLKKGGVTHYTFSALDLLDRVERVRLDPAYRTYFPGVTLDVPADAEAYLKVLQEQFPQEREGLRKLFDTLGSINSSMECLMNLQERREMGPTLWRIVKKPWMFWPLIQYWNKSAADMLADYIRDEKLIAVFTQLACFAGAEPDKVSGMFFAMMWTSYHFSDFTYFRGGSQAVSDALADVIRENGGVILLDTRVTQIVIKDGRAVAVRTADGKEFACRYVVSNANAPDTFFKLVGKEHLPEAYVERLENMKIGLSAFVVYLGVDHDYRASFPKGVHSYFVNSGFDQAENFRYYYEGVPEKSTYGLIDYTLVDPDDAPEGKNVICMATIMPYDYKGDWNLSEGYEQYTALKEQVAQALIRRSEQFLPGLSEHIEVMEVGSPRTMEHYTSNPLGTIFGWDNTPDQSMLNRLPQETPIDNLYLAGAWTFPGGGQSAVLMSGLQASKHILKRDRQEPVEKVQ